MTPQQSAASLQQQINQINAQIAALQAQLANTFDASDRADLNAQIASLEESRQALEDALNNIQGIGAGGP